MVQDDVSNHIFQKKPKVCTVDDLVVEFQSMISEGPTYVCCCCEQLWFKRSVKNVSTFKAKLSPHFSIYLQNIVNSDNSYICSTCHKCLQDGKSPATLSHGLFKLFQVPPELCELNSLEETLIALRIPFMKIQELPRGGQLRISGNVVNVPSNITATVSTLPRTLHEQEVIKLQLKRKMDYDHGLHLNNIRPLRVQKAAKCLVENSPLYKQENIGFDENFHIIPKLLYKITGQRLRKVMSKVVMIGMKQMIILIPRQET